MKQIGVGLLGFGTVGAGVVAGLQRNRALLSARLGVDVVVRRVADLDIATPRGVDVDPAVLTTDARAAIADPGVDIVVELIGGTGAARTLTMAALDAGKPVVTANKALLAEHGEEIFALAQQRGVDIYFGASVGGGIPIVRVLREGLVGNAVVRIHGILNGTCNYILTRMSQAGLSYAEALREAQAKGYAEADPTFDVEGIDAAHKLTILASIAFGIPLQFDKAYTEGITQLTSADVNYAEALGYRIKHLGVARRTEAGIELRVHPTLIPADRLIANVNGVMNAVMVNGDAVGSTLYYGAGAGMEPTASAVVADVIDVVRALTTDPQNRVPHLAFQADLLSDHPILPIAECQSAYYLRIQVQDRPGVLAKVATILSERGINIESIMQKEAEEQDGLVPLILLTHRVTEQSMNDAINALEALADVSGPVMRIRVEHLN